jgi:hypothetical protein
LIDGWNEKEGMMLLSLRDVVLSIVIWVKYFEFLIVVQVLFCIIDLWMSFYSFPFLTVDIFWWFREYSCSILQIESYISFFLNIVWDYIRILVMIRNVLMLLFVCYVVFWILQMCIMCLL